MNLIYFKIILFCYGFSIISPSLAQKTKPFVGIKRDPTRVMSDVDFRSSQMYFLNPKPVVTQNNTKRGFCSIILNSFKNCFSSTTISSDDGDNPYPNHAAL